MNFDPADEDAEHEPVNHRTIEGQRRRAITETKIIHAAVHVFAEQGLDAPVIDDFIKAAGIARGTFYNYFKSTDELLRATSDLLSEELISLIDKEIRSLKDPAIRYGVGIRLWMRWAEGNPLWCRFTARVWNSVKYEMPFQDIREGIRKKVFVAPDAYVAWDLISGAIRQAMFRIGEGSVRRNYGDAVVQMCLQALGVSALQIFAQCLQLPGLKFSHLNAAPTLRGANQCGILILPPGCLAHTVAILRKHLAAQPES